MAKAIPHGTSNAYQNHKCRCEECETAEREYRRRLKDEGPTRGVGVTHGTYSGYTRHKCRCDECVAAGKEYRTRYRAANGERVAEGQKAWRQANAERCAENARAWAEKNAEKLRLYQQQWQKDNAAQVAERSRAYRKANAESVYAAQVQWRKDNPARRADTHNASEQRRRARRNAAFIEDVPRREIFERDNWQCMIPGCMYPGQPVSLDLPHRDPLYASLDHVVPLAKGGLHERGNLVSSHLHCNIKKHTSLEGIA